MPTRFLIRFDDVCPTMSWEKFYIVKSRLEVLNIKSILGVVPECRDPNLNVDDECAEFFDRVRCWKKYGDTIAQHGTYHVYDTDSAGILGINTRSEFAGHDYVTQFERMQHGKHILINEDVWEPYFMAPAHSFDETTIQVLADLGFQALTDGYGFYPYTHGSIVMVPQLTSKPFKIGFGYSTICLHINSMTHHEIERLLNFVTLYADRFVDFPYVVGKRNESLWAAATRVASTLILRSCRYLR